MKTRKSKIARIPLDVREELNRRIENGEEGKQLVAWLNGHAETKRVMAASFGGRNITEQNLSEWRGGGYQDWLAQEEAAGRAEDFAEAAQKLAEATGGRLTDHLATVLAARYAELLANWTGEVTAEFRGRLEVLRALRKDVVALRRSEHEDARVMMAQGRYKWDEERFEWETEKADDEAINREWDTDERMREMKSYARHLEALGKKFSGPPPKEEVASGTKHPTTNVEQPTSSGGKGTEGAGIQDEGGESKVIQGNPTKSNLIQGKNERGEAGAQGERMGGERRR